MIASVTGTKKGQDFFRISLKLNIKYCSFTKPTREAYKSFPIAMSVHSVHSTTVPHGYVEPKIAPSGFASIPARTVNFQFKDTVSKHGNRPAMHLKRKVDVCVYLLIHLFCSYQQYSIVCRAKSHLNGRLGLGTSTTMIVFDSRNL